MPLLLMLAWLVSFVCYIIVLVKIFKSGNTVAGVLGLFCGPIAFIVGWMQHDDLDSTTIMQIWTLALVAAIGITFKLHSSGVTGQ